MFSVSLYTSAVHPDSLQQFFRHTLTEVLTYNPLLTGRSSECLQGVLLCVHSSIPPTQASLGLEEPEPGQLLGRKVREETLYGHSELLCLWCARAGSLLPSS